MTTDPKRSKPTMLYFRGHMVGTARKSAFAHLTFYDFHNLTSGPFSPITGSLFGSLTFGIVSSALR